MARGIGRAATTAALVVGLVSPAARGDEPSSSPSHAALSPAQESRLATLLQQGDAAAKSRRFEACAEAYSSALHLLLSAKTAGELGLCEEALGRYDRAHRHLSRAIDRAPSPAQGGTLQDPWKRYRAALERVSDRVARVIVLVQPASAEVLIDGESLGVQKSGHFIAVLPGTHTWTAKLDGYDDATVTHTVASGDVPDIALTLKLRVVAPPAPLQAAPPAGAAPTAAAVSTPILHEEPWYAPAPSARGVAIGLTYAGLATVVVAGVTTLALEADRSSIAASLAERHGASACTAEPAPSDCARLRTAKEARVIARTVTAVGAGVTGAAALAVVLLNVLPAKSGSPRVAIAPFAGGDGGGFIVTGAW